MNHTTSRLYSMFVEKFSGGVTYTLGLADRFNRERNWPEALRCYRRVLSARPDLAAVWVQRGHCEKELGFFSDAARSYRSAISADAAHWDSHLHLGRLLRDMGDIVAAFYHLKLAWLSEGGNEIALELSSLMGTKSPCGDVFVTIERSFDAAFYLSTNPDVQASGIDPAVHYMLFGWREGRAPSRDFDPEFYSEWYGDQVHNGVMPLVHFELIGRKKGERAAFGGGAWYTPEAPSQIDWDSVSPAVIGSDTTAVIVIPIYTGYAETLACVYHALRARGASRYGVVVVNDSSPDAPLVEVIEALAQAGLFTYQRNFENLGFVVSVNSAIRKYGSNRDIVLLNSDAYVYPGWFDRLQRHAMSAPRVATVTPLSNNATVCSYPVMDRDNSRALEVSPSQLDELIAVSMAGERVVAPTGVGFCMYMSRDAISEVGLLDEHAFGKGYGEENDFCRRAAGAGFINLIAHDVFVYHVGSVSFADTRLQKIKAGSEVLKRRYPSYEHRVSLYMKSDPGRHLRRKIDMARIKRVLGRCTVLITHKWGGGIEKFVRHRVDLLRSRGQAFLILRVHDGHFVSYEMGRGDGLFLPNLLNFDLRFEWAALVESLRDLDVSFVEFHSAAGLDWASHKSLLDLLNICGFPYSYTFHDYSSVSHYLTLVRPDDPEVSLSSWGDVEIAAKLHCSDFPDACDPQDRRATYHAFLSRAKQLLAPSEATKTVVRNFYPDLNIDVVPHEEPGAVWGMIRSHEGGRVRIAVVGALSLSKGFLHLLDLAGDASARQLPIDFFLVGHSHNDESLRHVGVAITGRYADDEEAVLRLREIGPAALFFPAKWPETYCYALTLAMRVGVPPVVYNCGAQSERVATWSWGHVLPVTGMSISDVNDFFLESCRLSRGAERGFHAPATQRGFFTESV